MATDQDYESRLKGWLAFGRLLRWVVGAIIVVLVGMAIFLV